MEKKQQFIAEYEPEPESSEAYETYMKDRFKAGAFDNAIISTPEVEKYRKRYWRNHEMIKYFTDKKLYYKNSILNFMNQNCVDAVNLDDKKQIKLTNKLTIPKLSKK